MRAEEAPTLASMSPGWQVYIVKAAAIIERRRKIKELTIQKRRLAHHRQAA